MMMARYSIFGSYLMDITELPTSSTTHSFEVCKSLGEIYVTFWLFWGCALGRNCLSAGQHVIRSTGKGKVNDMYVCSVGGESVWGRWWIGRSRDAGVCQQWTSAAASRRHSRHVLLQGRGKRNGIIQYRSLCHLCDCIVFVDVVYLLIFLSPADLLAAGVMIAADNNWQGRRP